MVVSRYKIYQLLLVYLSSILFLGIAIIIISKEDYTIKPIIGAAFTFSFAVYVPYKFHKRAPVIHLGQDFIEVKYPFGSFIFSWTDCTHLVLSGKENYSFLFFDHYSLEAMKMTFTNGRELIFWDDMYRNMAELRTFVVQQTQALEAQPHRQKRPRIVNPFIRMKYNGNPILSFNSLLVLGMVIFFIWKIPVRLEWIMFVPIGFILLLYLFFGFQMYYFILDGDHLKIRNQYFPWINKKIEIDTILLVVIESPYKRSTGLRIMIKDYRSRFYGAGSLRENHWKALAKDLVSIGINVRKDS